MHFLLKIRAKNYQKTQNLMFFSHYALFGGVRGSEGGHVTEIFFTKIFPKNHSTNLLSLGGPQKSRFLQF